LQRSLAKIRAFAPLFSVALTLILITGCSAVVTETEAPGTYRADADWGTSTLVLAKDHTFEQTVRPKDGPPRHITGTWNIARSSGQPVYTTVQFSPFLSITHDKQGVFAGASMYSIYHVPFGGINIAADPDYGIAHRK
jgi:hypothetical protein